MKSWLGSEESQACHCVVVLVAGSLGRWATGKCVETYNGVSRGLSMKHSPNLSGAAASPEIAKAKIPPSTVEESPPAEAVAHLVIAFLSSGV